MASETTEPKNKSWVKFEEEEGGPEKGEAGTEGSGEQEYSGAVINAETSQINLDRRQGQQPPPAGQQESKAPPSTSATPAAVITPESVHISLNRTNLNRSVTVDIPANKTSETKNALRSVDLRENANGRSATTTTTTVGNAVIRQGFANGDIIVTLLPVNTRWPWITPAKFRPELVPEELMAQGLTLTVEDYVSIMELLTNDVRFALYNVCYKRILVLWILTAFLVLLGLLVSGVTGLTLFGLGVMWLLMNAAAVFICMWAKIKLNHNLERCLGQVNKLLLRHKIILGLDDRGKISCHKVNLCFIYFDTTDCIKKLQEVIDREEREGRAMNREETAEERRQRTQFQQRMDIQDSDIVVQGSNTTRISRKQERAELLYLRYSSRWVKNFMRRLLELNVDGGERGGLPPAPPRHCVSARCPCQFVEEHLRYKPRGKLNLSRFFHIPDAT